MAEKLTKDGLVVGLIIDPPKAEEKAPEDKAEPKKRKPKK